MLTLHSEEDYNSFCLSYMFTHRDFDDGILGLAWTADAENHGGLCSKYTVSIVWTMSLDFHYVLYIIVTYV